MGCQTVFVSYLSPVGQNDTNKTKRKRHTFRLRQQTGMIQRDLGVLEMVIHYWQKEVIRIYG
jgi:hypothetical protein